jgi:hypothetical protein
LRDALWWYIWRDLYDPVVWYVARAVREHHLIGYILLGLICFLAGWLVRGFGE